MTINTYALREVHRGLVSITDAANGKFTLNMTRDGAELLIRGIPELLDEIEHLRAMLYEANQVAVNMQGGDE